MRMQTVNAAALISFCRARLCLLHCCALDPSLSLCACTSKKKEPGKEKNKTISQSRNRNIPLRNHHGDREVADPEKPGMKQPKTPGS